MKKLAAIIGILIITSCASKKSITTSRPASKGDTRTTPVELLDDRTYLLTVTADDTTYGFYPSNPVNVGGIKELSGPKNERMYLNGLLGPNGETINYHRAGSCCQFTTPNGMFENMGLLDQYRIYWVGSTDTFNIYMNMYDKGDLKIPVGLNSRKH